MPIGRNRGGEGRREREGKDEREKNEKKKKKKRGDQGGQTVSGTADGSCSQTMGTKDKKKVCVREPLIKPLNERNIRSF